MEQEWLRMEKINTDYKQQTWNFKFKINKHAAP